MHRLAVVRDTKVSGCCESFVIEATAVMVVTTCLIPRLVIAFFGWVIKTLFDVQFDLPPRLNRGPKHQRLHGETEE